MPISRWSIGPPTIQTEWPYSKVGGPLIDKLLPGSDLYLFVVASPML